MRKQGGGAGHPVVLFDGSCNFCNGWVRFIIRHDRRARFRFAPLQSEAGRRLAASCGEGMDGPAGLESVVLVEDGRCFVRSEAVLRIGRNLDGWGRLAALLALVPAPLRDRAYGWAARHRYRFFGRRDACAVPGDDVRDRFLKSD